MSNIYGERERVSKRELTFSRVSASDFLNHEPLRRMKASMKKRENSIARERERFFEPCTSTANEYIYRELSFGEGGVPPQ